MPGHQVSSRSGEGLLCEERLRHRGEFLRCYRVGRRRHGSVAILYFLPNQLHHPRIGITASRKVGGAVVRHRLRRRTREIYRRWPNRSRLPALDLVVHFRPGAGDVEFVELKRDLHGLLSSLLRNPRSRRS